MVLERKTMSRRGFLKAGGALVVISSTVPAALRAALGTAAAAEAPWPAIPLDQVDSYLAIGRDGKVVGAAGKVNAGMGVDTAFAQIVAEELDVAFDDVTIRLGDTATTPDQGGTGGSNGVMTSGQTFRHAAAQARQFLLHMASQELSAPVAQLTVKNGVVSVRGNGTKRVPYGDLIGGRRFDLTLSNDAPLKPASDYTVVGQPVKRREISAIATGKHTYIVDVRVRGMVHARVVRPPVAGARLTGVTPLQSPGLLRVVTKGNYVAVVATTEWSAIKAAQLLDVTWAPPARDPFPASYDALYQLMATATPVATNVAVNKGSVDDALASATRVVEGVYQSAFQSHASMGPACAIADVSAGKATVWFGGQKPYRVKLAIADLLGMAPSQVRVIWYPGPGSYGTNDADDVAVEAAFIAQQAGRPVRLQFMRNEGTGWDPKGPPALITMRAGIDGAGNVIAWDFASREFSGTQRAPGALDRGDTLIGQLLGAKPKESNEFGIAADGYEFPAERKVGSILDWDQALATGLRTGHLRDPNGPQTTFASESFVDEVASALGMDPVRFRLAHLNQKTGARDIAVIQAAARAARWDTRPSPRTGQTGTVVRGRGIAYAPRGTTYVATVAEVEVNKSSGEVRVLRLVCAQDTGLIINPNSLRRTVEANLMHSTSRALHEAVQFDGKSVQSIDWRTYPILTMAEAPDLEVVLLNRPDLPSGGAGEPASRPTAAAIGNAIFDATGWRARRQPFTPATVKAAIQA